MRYWALIIDTGPEVRYIRSMKMTVFLHNFASCAWWVTFSRQMSLTRISSYWICKNYKCNQIVFRKNYSKLSQPFNSNGFKVWDFTICILHCLQNQLFYFWTFLAFYEFLHFFHISNHLEYQETGHLMLSLIQYYFRTIFINLAQCESYKKCHLLGMC